MAVKSLKWAITPPDRRLREAKKQFQVGSWTHLYWWPWTFQGSVFLQTCQVSLCHWRGHQFWSPAHPLGLSFRVGSPSAPGTLLDKTQSLNPPPIFWISSHLEMRATSKSLGSPRGPLEKCFYFCCCSLVNLQVAVVLAANNTSPISFLSWVYSFISTFISFYFMLTKWPLFS